MKVELVDKMGTDLSVVNAARVSYAKYKDSFENKDENNEYYEMPPERDLRDTQPTISVNYRVIKNKAENEPKEIKQRSGDSRYQDDWENENTEW